MTGVQTCALPISAEEVVMDGTAGGQTEVELEDVSGESAADAGPERDKTSHLSGANVADEKKEFDTIEDSEGVR